MDISMLKDEAIMLWGKDGNRLTRDADNITEGDTPEINLDVLL